MARTVAELPAGVRLTDHISLGVLTASVPRDAITEILRATERESIRQRELPAHVMVYYVIALALYADVSTREVLRCLLEGIRWLGDRSTDEGAVPPVKSAISQARARLGAAPMELLYRRVVAPIATAGTPGAWYRGWRVMSLDGTTLDVSDTVENAHVFGRPGSVRGASAFPQLRVLALLENGTHVLHGAILAPYTVAEPTLAPSVVAHLTGEMLCLADRGFYSRAFWRQALKTGAALLWRVRHDLTLPVEERYDDGSYRSRLPWNAQSADRDRGPLPVRVIEYTVPTGRNRSRYCLITSILEPARAPAEELARLYHERWEIETAFDEFKTHLKGAGRVLRSKTPDLVYQEAWGFLIAHSAIRGLMHEAALGALPRARDADTLSYTHAVRVVRRTLPRVAAIPPSGLANAGARTRGDSPRTSQRARELQSRSRRPPRSETQDE